MSLHAQLSPAARAALERQRRGARVTSVIAGIAGTVLLSLALALFLMPAPEPTAKVVKWIDPGPETPPDIPPPTTRTTISNPAAPSARALPHIQPDIASPFSMPKVDPSDVESPGFGTGLDGDGLGDALGDEGMGNDGFIPLPPPVAGRCSQADRIDRLREAGVPSDSDEHVVRALRFLKSTQAADGGWGSRNRPAMTGLALLAYLGHCETSISEEFGDSCLKAILFLTDIGLEHNGRLVPHVSDRHWPYEQAIATYALAEAETFHRALGIQIPELRGVVAKAGQIIIEGQHASGGWDYAYDTEGTRGGDLSITGWQLQALKACKLTGLDFRNLRSCVKKGLEYTEARQSDDGGFGYQGTRPAGGSTAGLTGVGMLTFQIWGKASASPVRHGEKYAAKEMRFEWDGPDCDLYAHYYLSQAMFRRGGTAWDKYQPQIFDGLLPNQSDDGSWPVPGGGSKPNAVGALFANNNPDGRHYRTTLAALMLEVPYRYLPMDR
ncbi:prenyltransferase/squalene oxidase repeat-containing protein [Haloferula sp. A504]|uniref:prenyltransferase/squalene oxidase repeat-containing protein n=1 Tax=Haloferula sp. A504 TaxID=3373601 RepID=UPI0031BC947B|nr:terpene cyclase/mutase family protein [Verrucomicrobiaceae bacterium E54]